MNSESQVVQSDPASANLAGADYSTDPTSAQSRESVVGFTVNVRIADFGLIANCVARSATM